MIGIASLWVVQAQASTFIGQWTWQLPQEKKNPNRAPPCEELDPPRTISSLFLCRKLHLFLGKSTKIAATRAALIDSNMRQSFVGPAVKRAPEMLVNSGKFCRNVAL